MREGISSYITTVLDLSHIQVIRLQKKKKAISSSFSWNFEEAQDCDLCTKGGATSTGADKHD